MISMLRRTIIYIHLNELISENYNCMPIWLSDFQRNQSKILIIPPKFFKFNLKKL